MHFLRFCFLTIFLFISVNLNAKTIEEQFSDAESLIDIDQTKTALELLKKIEPETEEQTAKQFFNE